ncbi:trypsin-like serine peptidase [Mesorhizobium amorphae]|uniref:trypsin-like serine peptidase n=1 Tax=Mesorhizobium amorphae TaxID=71433 RepID=UPI0017842D58|nr:serine protease [Mesorhizobium amorphae]
MTPDEILSNLADVSVYCLSRYDFAKLWDRATTTRLETIEVTTDDPKAQRLAQLRALKDSGALSDFVRAWIATRGDPAPQEREAIKLYVGSVSIDLSRWENADPAKKQAALEERDAFLNTNDIFEILRTDFPRVCCIVGKAQRVVGGLPVPTEVGGTGFLVAPDVVLTNWHVVEPLLDDQGKQRAGSHTEFAVFFDHIRKEKIPRHDENWGDTTRVPPAEGWYLGGSPKSKALTDFATAFDFALIQLATPIGKAARNGRFGEPRGWIRIPEAGFIGPPAKDTGLLCPQHPGGMGRVFAFGRALQLYDGSDNRLAYSLSSEKGSSGSPVLSAKGALVALHEADGLGAGPQDPDPAEHNRGILLSAFAAMARDHLHDATNDPPPVTGLWAVRTPTETRHPLLGRKMLLDWIEGQIAADPTTLPIHVITGGPRTGKSFSIDVLRTRLETLPDIVLAFAPTSLTPEGQGSADRSTLLLPERPDALLAEIANALSLPTETIPRPPPEVQKRSTELGPGDAEDRKLNDWASTSLTKWLAETMQTEKTDLKRRLWIVLDVPPGTPFGPGMQSFLKSMVPAADGDHQFDIFRWIYINYTPVFLGSAVPVEKLTPKDDIKIDDLKDFLGKMFTALGKRIPEDAEIEESFDYIDAMKGSSEELFWGMVRVALKTKIDRHFAKEPRP